MRILKRGEDALGSANWNTLAELDPMWTILSDPRKKFCKWEPTAFFRTGQRETERVLGMCNAHGIGVTYGRMLDFGCGVGRMTRAFSTFFDSCVGIDVSQEMIALAKKFNSELQQCEFIASNAGSLPFTDKSFDFVFTVLVLQHMATKRVIFRYIEEFLRVAKDGAVIIFQLPNEVPLRRRLQLRRRLWRLFASVGVPRPWLFHLGLVPIQINGISERKVKDFVRGHGGRVLAVERYDPNEGRFHSNYYMVEKRQAHPSSCKGCSE